MLSRPHALDPWKGCSEINSPCRRTCPVRRLDHPDNLRMTQTNRNSRLSLFFPCSDRLIPCSDQSGNMGSNLCNHYINLYNSSPNWPKIRKFPVIFPVLREFGARCGAAAPAPVKRLGLRRPMRERSGVALNVHATNAGPLSLDRTTLRPDRAGAGAVPLRLGRATR